MSNVKATQIAVLLQYTYIGLVVPRSVRTSMMQLIDDVLASDFELVRPWIVAEPSVWSAVRANLEFWRTAQEGVGFSP